MPAPCNAKHISLGSAPWNLYPARNVDTNGHIEGEYFNLLTPDEDIPLGICNSKKRFPKSSTNTVFVELFLCLFTARIETSVEKCDLNPDLIW